MRMSHVTHMYESRHAYVWVMSHIWMGHVTHVYESCHIYEWVPAHICMSHVTHTNHSCHTCEWVMSHIWMGHVTHMHESCHTSSHIWMGHVTHMHESCHTYEWVTVYTLSHLQGHLFLALSESFFKSSQQSSTLKFVGLELFQMTRLIIQVSFAYRKRDLYYVRSLCFTWQDIRKRDLRAFATNETCRSLLPRMTYCRVDIL